MGRVGPVSADRAAVRMRANGSGTAHVFVVDADGTVGSRIVEVSAGRSTVSTSTGLPAEGRGSSSAGSTRTEERSPRGRLCADP